MRFPKFRVPPESRPARSGRSSGFTLVELLIVMAVIMILVGITFGISRGVQNAQARAEAKAELAVLAQSLEQFKSRHGDYPWINRGNDRDRGAHELLKALTGWREATDADTLSKEEKNKPVIEAGKLSLSRDWDNENPPGTEVYLQDPWGNPYVYLYKQEGGDGSTWERFGFLLFSMGPDGKISGSQLTENTGIIEDRKQFREDNPGAIFAGEE